MLLGIVKTKTTPLHSESDGMVEKYNRALKSQLLLFVEEHQPDWDKHIPLLLMEYWTAVHSSTKFTPAEIMMGREIEFLLIVNAFGCQPTHIPENYSQYIQDLRAHM